jgi:hypothetical protein
MKLRRVGFFREFAYGDPNGPSLRAAVRPDPAPDEIPMAVYLYRAVVLAAVSGASDDVLDPAGGYAPPPHLMTDGVWLWPADLSYYVRRYHVRLPDEFVAHMRARAFRPPGEGEIALSAVKL